MAARVTEGEVRAIIETDLNATIAPFIEEATALTDYLSTKDTAQSSVLNDTLLKLIEKNLAAHFYAIYDLQYHQKSTEKASGTFQGKTAMGLDSTLWGQKAKTLDISGILARLDSKPRPVASVAWLGLPPSEQTPYVDRD